MQTLQNGLGLFRDRKTPQEGFVKTDDDITLTPRQNIVHVSGFAGAVAVTLPPVADCAGCIFAITVLDDSGTNNVTVQDQNDSLDWTDQVIDNVGGGSVLLFCDGQKFWVLVADLT